MMTHILPKLYEKYKNILEVLEYKLDDYNNTLTIERICDKLLVKYDLMNKQSIPTMSREDGESLYIKITIQG